MNPLTFELRDLPPTLPLFPLLSALLLPDHSCH